MKVLPTLSRLVVGRLRRLMATGDQRDAEILALRHQLLVLQRQVARAAFTDAARTILAVLSEVFDRKRLGDVLSDREAGDRDWLAPSPCCPPLGST